MAPARIETRKKCIAHLQTLLQGELKSPAEWAGLPSLGDGDDGVGGDGDSSNGDDAVGGNGDSSNGDDGGGGGEDDSSNGDDGGGGDGDGSKGDEVVVLMVEMGMMVVAVAFAVGGNGGGHDAA